MLTLQLSKETEDGTLLEKIAVYNRANKEVHLFTMQEKTVYRYYEFITGFNFELLSPINRLP
jgi:hypothetical protein